MEDRLAVLTFLPCLRVPCLLCYPAGEPTGFQRVSCFYFPFSIVGCWHYRSSYFEVQLLCGYLESRFRFTGLYRKHFPEPRKDSFDSAEAV